MRYVYISSTPTSLPTSYLHRCRAAARALQTKSRFRKVDSHFAAILITLPFSFFEISYSLDKIYLISFIKISSNISMTSSDFDVFYVEQVSNEPSPERNNSPNILNSTETSQTYVARMPSVSSIASPESRIFTIDDDSNEPTMPYGFGRQLPIVPPSLNNLNFPPNLLTSSIQWPW